LRLVVAGWAFTSLPLLYNLQQFHKTGTGTTMFSGKTNEIWHSGYYPVVWSNKNYKMVYLNMGHNDIDYEHKYDNSNKTLSFTLDNKFQERLIINSLLWLGNNKVKHSI
jgi:hypothetical protein